VCAAVLPRRSISAFSLSLRGGYSRDGITLATRVSPSCNVPVATAVDLDSPELAKGPADVGAPNGLQTFRTVEWRASASSRDEVTTPQIPNYLQGEFQHAVEWQSARTSRNLRRQAQVIKDWAFPVWRRARRRIEVGGVRG